MRSFEDLDVCSSKFSFSRAEYEVKKQGCRMLCDVLLDQAVLPGVGNIIKNEALFDSGLHPAVQVQPTKPLPWQMQYMATCQACESISLLTF